MDYNVSPQILLERVAAYIVSVYDAQTMEGIVEKGWAAHVGLNNLHYWDEDLAFNEELFDIVFWEKPAQDRRDATWWEYPLPNTYCIACGENRAVQLGSNLLPSLCSRHLSPVHMVGLPHVCQRCLSLTNDTVTVMIPGARNLMDANCSYCGFRRMYIK